jgi:hypothetical protein
MCACVHVCSVHLCMSAACTAVQCAAAQRCCCARVALLAPAVGSGGPVVVAAGWHHSAVATRTNAFLTWGWGNYGQLGHGDNCNAATPRAVEALEGSAALAPPGARVIPSVACGAFHTLFLSALGDVYAAGFGSRGQLGLMPGPEDGGGVPGPDHVGVLCLPDGVRTDVPVLVDALEDVRCVQVRGRD